MAHPLDRYSVKFSAPLQWGELDYYGHLNNVAYHRYFESARVAYLTELGVMKGAATVDGIALVVGWNSCRYFRPVAFPDTLQVGARVSAVGGEHCTLQYGLYSEQQQCLVATGESQSVTYDLETAQKVAIPERWLAGIQRLEGRMPPTPGSQRDS